MIVLCAHRVFDSNHVLPAALQKLSGTALYIIPELGGNDLFYAALLGKTPAEAIATTVPDAIAALGLNLKVAFYDHHDLNIWAVTISSSHLPCMVKTVLPLLTHQ